MRLPVEWQADAFTHNAAILRVEDTKAAYVVIGGKQGFVSDPTCRRPRCRPLGSNNTFQRVRDRCKVVRRTLGPGWIAQRSSPDCTHQGLRHGNRSIILECLWNKSRRADCLLPSEQAMEQALRHGGDHAAANNHSASHGSSPIGIRVARGHGLPWRPENWTLPGLPIVTGRSPSGCVDRRPAYTGYPRVLACEFDGRLSLVHHHGMCRIYARSNLKFGAVAGGRAVQTTSSAELERGWRPWVPVRISGIEPDKVDIYFFAVQRSPLGSTGTGTGTGGAPHVALFPLTEQPIACVMLAFSADGVVFSKPISLRLAMLGVRTQSRNGLGHLEWRSEDHPVAGIVRAPHNSSTLLFYVHHAVRGTTVREGAKPHVRVYQLDVDEFQRQAQLSMISLTQIQ